MFAADWPGFGLGDGALGGTRHVLFSYSEFQRRFCEVFVHTADRRKPGEEIFSLKQGFSSVAKFTILFRILAARNGWSFEPLKALFRKALNRELQAELACLRG